VNLDFLTVSSAAGAIARSPMEPQLRAAGARFEVRDGWNVAVSIGAASERETAVAAQRAGWADVSHLGKLEVQGPPEGLERVAAACGAAHDLRCAKRFGDAWWCRMSATRLLVIGCASELRTRLQAAVGETDGTALADVTSTFAAMTLTGPLAREVFARFCALDLRPEVTPVRALRPGSIARQPGILICEAEDRYLFLFGWATGEYMWSVVTDAGEHLGGRPIGVDALAPLDADDTEVSLGA
jgi:glycine cleavage system aminomethyltransferase T